MKDEKCVFMNFPDGSTAMYPSEFRERVHRYKKWRIQKGNASERMGGDPIYYVVTNDKQPVGKVLFLHKLLYPEFKMIEHIDGDGLNNMRDNIRQAVGRKNAGNPMRCIQWQKDKNTFYVRVKQPNGKRKCKHFSVRKHMTREGALKAAQAFRDELHDEFEMK